MKQAEPTANSVPISLKINHKMIRMFIMELENWINFTESLYRLILLYLKNCSKQIKTDNICIFNKVSFIH